MVNVFTVDPVSEIIDSLSDTDGAAAVLMFSVETLIKSTITSVSKKTFSY